MKAGASDYLPKGRLSAGTLPHAVVNAVQQFRMQRQIEQQRSALAASERRYQTLLEAIPQMVWSANAEGRVEYANRRWFEYTGLVPGRTPQPKPHLGWDRLLHPGGPRANLARVEPGKEVRLGIRNRTSASGERPTGATDGIWCGPFLCGPAPERFRTGWAHARISRTRSKPGMPSSKKRNPKGSAGLAGGVAHDFNNLLVCILGGASCAMQSLPASHPAQEMLQGCDPRGRAGGRAHAQDAGLRRQGYFSCRACRRRPTYPGRL
jgi:PAS domain-containing protein